MKLVDVDAIERDGILGCAPTEFPFAFLPAYVRFEQARSGSRIGFLQSDRLRATAPVRLYRNRIMRLGQWLSPPYRDGRRLDRADELDFLQDAVRLLGGDGLCHRLIQPPPEALFQAAPPGARQCRFGAYVLDLEGRTEDELLEAMHSSHRRDIRRAERDGAVVRLGPGEIPAFHALYESTMRAAGFSAVSLEHLIGLHAVLGDQHLVCAMAYDPDGVPLGGALGPRTRQAFYYLYGCSAPRPSIPGAVKLATWRLICDCLAAGARQYNFVGARLSDVSGTKLDDIQSFKSRFGSTLQEGVLWKADLSPAHVAVYDTVNGLRLGYRRLRHGGGPPARDIIDQEIARSRLSPARA
jgi:hypothetical protein